MRVQTLSVGNGLGSAVFLLLARKLGLDGGGLVGAVRVPRGWAMELFGRRGIVGREGSLSQQWLVLSTIEKVVSYGVGLALFVDGTPW